MYHLPAEAPVELLLIGQNMEAPGIGQLIADCPNAYRIHRLGYRTDVHRVVKSCDVLALPSLNESTPKVVIEAMSLGIAPVVTDIHGVLGLVVDGECGLVVPPADPKALAVAILRLAQDRALCQYFGKNAQARMRKKMHIRDTVLGYKKIYEELASH